MFGPKGSMQRFQSCLQIRNGEFERGRSHAVLFGSPNNRLALGDQIREHYAMIFELAFIFARQKIFFLFLAEPLDPSKPESSYEGVCEFNWNRLIGQPG